jgi:hypothetical protein
MVFVCKKHLLRVEPEDINANTEFHPLGKILSQFHLLPNIATCFSEPSCYDNLQSPQLSKVCVQFLRPLSDLTCPVSRGILHFATLTMICNI